MKAAAHALFRLQAGATLYEKTASNTMGSTRSRAVMGRPRDSIAAKAEAKNPGGLSIYLGGRGKAFLDHGYAQTRFARATGWDTLLRAVNAN